MDVKLERGWDRTVFLQCSVSYNIWTRSLAPTWMTTDIRDYRQNYCTEEMICFQECGRPKFSQHSAANSSVSSLSNWLFKMFCFIIIVRVVRTLCSAQRLKTASTYSQTQRECLCLLPQQHIQGQNTCFPLPLGSSFMEVPMIKDINKDIGDGGKQQMERWVDGWCKQERF